MTASVTPIGEPLLRRALERIRGLPRTHAPTGVYAAAREELLEALDRCGVCPDCLLPMLGAPEVEVCRCGGGEAG